MPALYLFGRRTLLGGDDLHVPALATATVRVIQLLCLVSPLVIFVWKQALIIADDENDANANSNSNSNSNSSGLEWPVWKYLFDWWGELEATASNDINDDINNNNNNNDAPPVCVGSVFARYYPLLSVIHLLCTVVFCFHSLSLEYKIWHWSSQGTPTMRQPRTKNVQELLEKKLGISTVLLALIVGGIYYVTALFFARPYHLCFHSILDYNNNDNNDDDAGASHHESYLRWVGSPTWYAMGALLAASQTAEVVVAALFYARLKNTISEETINVTAASSSAAVVCSSNSSSSLHVHHELSEELWADRCESLFRCLSISTCFLFGGKDLIDNAERNNSYKHVAQALADYLETKGTLDVVPTDIFTGLFVLQRIQKQRILQTRQTISEESSSLLAASVRLGGGSGDHTTTTTIINSNNKSNSDNSGGLITRALGTTASCHSTSSPDHMDSHYHQIASPDVAKTGLRSRVASSNDIGLSLTSTPAKTPTRKAPAAPHSTSSILDLDSSLIRAPLPPSQHLQQKQGLRLQQQQQGQRRIYRRVNHSSDTADASLLLPANSSTGESAFYRTTSRQIMNPTDPIDVDILEEGARMCKYALSIYTWMLYVFVHPITGIPRLVCQYGGKSSSERRMADCCCKSCGILKNNSSSSPTGASIPLRRHSPESTNGNYDTNSTNPSALASSSRHSNEASDIFDDEMEMGVGFDSENGDDHHQEIFNGDRSQTSGDTFCEWHKRALLLVAGIPEADLVYAEFNNKISSVPYCILLDHERSLVVLSIRGSLSLEDIVTDTLVLPESLEEAGTKHGFDGRGQYCHAGVLACFENVMRDLERHCWLERLLEEQYPEYNLRIVGHSLGAGVCVLLGYVLRSKYPTLKVYGYSPPGCTMTWEMANGCQDFCTTFVLDSDIVPRLSVLALEDLRDEVLELIGRIKVPKHMVYQNFWKGSSENQRNRSCLFGRRSRGEADDYNYEDDLDELTQTINETLDEVPSDTTYQRQLMDFLRVQDERKQARGETNSKNLRMYPPGTMIHLVRTGEERGCSHCLNQCLSCCTSNSGFVYTPVYISNDDLDEIVVTSTMGTDHFVDRMCDELHTLSDRYCSETHTNGREATAYPCGL